MAAVTHRENKNDTANVATYVTDAFTPAAGELLIGFFDVTTSVAVGTCTASANGITFTKVLSSVRGTSAHTQYCFVANQLVPGSPASMTVTMDVTGDNGTGCVGLVGGVSGMTLTGLAAIKQSTKIDNGAAGAPAVFTFGASCLTGNPTLTMIGTAVGTWW